MPPEYTPRTACVGRTGLASDAAMLSVEPKRIWLRMRPRPPGCTAGLMPLKMPMPATSMLRSTVADSQSTSTPTASRMSTAPHLDVSARAPCRASRAPPAAAMIAAAELTLNVLSVSMPVPEFSTSGPVALPAATEASAAGTVSNSTIACQAPAISSGRLALGDEGGEQRPLLQVGLLAEEHLAEELVGALARQVLAVDQTLDVGAEGPEGGVVGGHGVPLSGYRWTFMPARRATRSRPSSSAASGRRWLMRSSTRRRPLARRSSASTPWRKLQP